LYAIKSGGKISAFIRRGKEITFYFSEIRVYPHPDPPLKTGEEVF
jgi:hypothetical protein